MSDEMDFYTTVLRKSGNYHVALCLENGLAGQGKNKSEFHPDIKKITGIIPAHIEVREKFYNYSMEKHS